MEFTPDLLTLLVFLLALGAFAGFMAGLLGIGGGAILVPGLYYSFKVLSYDPAVIMHMAVGTALALIIPTGLSSAHAHWKNGALRPDLFKAIAPGIIIGVIIAILIADHMSGRGLQVFFACALIILAALMISDLKRFQVFDTLPRQPIPTLAGTIVGSVSTLVGIGGGVLNVPFMTFCRVPIHQAIGTAAALGIVISLPAAIGFFLIGTDEGIDIPFTFGYINALAWLIIFPASISMAPVGANVTKRAPVKTLKRLFALMMVLVAAKMVYDIWYG